MTNSPHKGDTMTEQPDELSVLDYFAAAALTGLAGPVVQFDGDEEAADIAGPVAASLAYDFAEAMMAERAKRQQPQPTEATK